MAGIAALAGLRRGAPLVDGELASMDAWLGLGTQGVVAWTASHPVAGQVLQVAYLSTVPLLFLTALLLACSGRRVVMWGPCLAFYRMSPSVLAGLPDGAGLFHMHTLEAFRSGSQATIQASDMEGVVVFPSLHAAMACMITYAFREMRRLRTVCWAWCALMFASTIPIGGHYVIDLVAGAAVWAAFACFAHVLARPGTKCVDLDPSRI